MANNTLTQTDGGLSGLTSAIETLIGTTRRLLRSTWVVTGLAVSTGLFLTLLLAVALLDLAVPLWPSLRLCGLLLVLLPTVWAAFVGVIRPAFRKLTQVMVARRIEQELPGIHNRLVSCVDFSRLTAGRKYSQSFHSRLVHEAYDRIREFHPRKVLDLLSLRRAGLFATASAALFVLILFLFSDRLPTAIARIFQPFADIPPASGVLYDVLVGDQTEPGDYETLRGEDVVFAVVLKEGEVDPPGGSDPLRLEIHLVDDEGAPRMLHYEFPELLENQTSFTLTGMQDSFTYRVRGGGTWSREFSVSMLDRPRIVALQTAVHLPDYMGIEEPIPGVPGTADVSGPRGSTVEVTVDVEGDASEGEIELLQEQSKLVPVTDRAERIWFADEYPAGSTAEGQWLYDEELLTHRGHTDAAATGLHAHGFLAAPIGFEIRPSESLFAYVYLSLEDMPETVMLRFHDGDSWEHRAFWGADKIGEGQPDSPARQYMGELPAAGKIVRLEVPARKLDLEGRRIYGVSYALFGGNAVWGPTGSLPPAQKRVTELVVTEAALLRPLSPTPSGTEADAEALARWSGKFQLSRDGYYRVVLRNRLSDPNQRMQEGKLTAIPDNPPQVAIDRPGLNLVVSEPIKVPVTISSYDDFGIDDIVLSVQSGDEEPFQGRPIVKFPAPVRSDHRTVMLDLAEEGLALGETLRYRVVVRDRKGQTATTVDHTIRMADESTAADREIAQIEEQTETLQEKLQALVEQQAEVTEQVEELAEEYAPLTEEIEQALEDAAADPNQPADQPPQMTLDEESQQELDELRTKMAEIKPLEDEAVQLSQEIAAELQQLADQSEDQALLPAEVAEQLQGVPEAFEQLAVEPLQELSEMMQAATQPSQPDPQLAEVQEQSEDVQQSLEDLQTRIEAIARAQEMSRENATEAVAELQRDVMQQNAELTARELRELQEFMEAMREDVAELGEQQEELMADARQDISDQLFEKLAEAQEQLEEASEPVLEDVAELLDSKMLEEIREQNSSDEETVEDDPAEDESTEPQDEADGPDQENPPAEPAVDDAEPPAQEIDPAEAGESEAEGDPVREEIQERQQELAQELDMAEENLAFEQEVLEDLIESLASQLPQDAEDSLTPEQAEQLAELMSAESTREALAMFQRLEEMLGGEEQGETTDDSQEAVAAQLPPTVQLNDIGNEDGVIGGVDAILVELEDLDLETRMVIMKMQPREREDLLQGFREDGPEGYREFIREYFHRLTRVRGNDPE